MSDIPPSDPVASRRPLRNLLQALAIVAGLFLVPMGVIGYPFFHNYHVTALARLHKRVHPGDDCAATATAFARYFRARQLAGSTDVQFADQSTDGRHEFGSLRPHRRLLHLYDLTVFDDVQLTAICDAAGRRVERVLYVGD
ncbi:hypothetical protein [Longimicrobium sp.]|uniref:hypothetical protein n=1 Tax=Longimicrobium sp. TaxID=2029185 RepID=UPI003B3B3C57